MKIKDGFVLREVCGERVIVGEGLGAIDFGILVDGAIVMMEKALLHSEGNFYINDKCTGAVVGQQPFGGSRASGTNDKAGTALNMIRWMSPHSVKETFNPSDAIVYPYMSEK